jgi:hypothetical protein
MSEQDRLAQAAALAKAGNRAEAQKIIAQVILANKDNADAWILMAKIADDPRRALQCWQQAARLRPDDLRLMWKLARIRGETLSQVPTQTGLPAVQIDEPAAPADTKTPVPLLITGAVVLVAALGGLAIVIANRPMQPNTDRQAVSATPTTAQRDASNTPVAAAEQSSPTSVSLSATPTQRRTLTRTPAPVTAPTTLVSTAAPQPSPTDTPSPTSTPTPTNTPALTNAPARPTATQSPPVIEAGIHRVGAGIKPGIYRGQAASETTCYWARLDEDSEPIVEFDSFGQFYLDVRSTDYALETVCTLNPLESLPPPGAFLQTIPPGMYLVGRDIQAGTYQGQAGTDGCYWELLSDVSGEPDSLLTGNFEFEGPFSVKVFTGDFALMTDCQLTRTAD